MHARGVVPKEEGLAAILGPLHEVDQILDQHLVEGGHVVFGVANSLALAAVGRASGVETGSERPLVDDLLLANRTPARLDGDRPYRSPSNERGCEARQRFG